MRKLIYGGVVAWLVVACASPIKKAEEFSAQDEWLKAVIEYRKAFADNPKDVEIRSRLTQAELKAADFYYQRGARLLDQGAMEGAIVQFQHGLTAMPEHSKLQQAMALALARQEADTLTAEAARHIGAGKPDEGKRLLERALSIHADNKAARDALARLDQETAKGKDRDELALSSQKPITLNFRQTDLRTAFEFIAKSFGVNVLFDEGLKSVPVTLFAQDVTFQQALNLLFTTHHTFYKRIGPNTILIIPDTKDKRAQYEDHIVRTFQLNSVPAKEMADVLKGLITVKKITINDHLNTLVVRDTEETLSLIEKIIASNDRKPAEMILEVEILEVNRAKTERLGLDLGSYTIAASVPAALPLASSIPNAVQANAILMLPSAAFRFYKQDVDAKTLANPKVRVMNGKVSKIHVGDRVPLRAATIVDATGQSRTTYDYKDIGIKLTAEPTIHVDNSATVKLGLEVSSLGENIGTPEEPAYRIGTRNAETFMLLRDGETAILGGLIRDEDRASRVRIPLLGDIPALGALFTSLDKQGGRTDVLLTITPRVVRGWDLPSRDLRQFYSGTADNYANQPLFADMQAPLEPGVTPVVQQTKTPPPPTSTAATAAAAPTPPPSTTANVAPTTSATPATIPPAPAAAGLPPILSFSQPLFEAASEQEVEVRLTGEHLSGVQSLPMEILYNPQLLTFVSAAALPDMKAENFKVEPDAAKGVLRLQLSLPADAPAAGALARVVLKAVKPGVSYLVYRSAMLTQSGGSTVNAQVRAARVVIK